MINDAQFGLSKFGPQYIDPRHPLYDQLFGIGEAPNTYIPTSHSLYNPEVPVYRFNPQEAIVLLEQVGWIDHDDDHNTPRRASSIAGIPDDTFLEFDYWMTSSSQRKQTAQILAESLAECGVQVNIQHWKPAEFYELPGSPDAAYVGVNRHLTIDIVRDLAARGAGGAVGRSVQA